MMPHVSLLAESVTRTAFEFGRIQSNTDWILPIAVFVGLFLYVVAMYRRDTAELSPAWAVLLVTLRTVALAGVLVVYLEPQWRNERDVVQNSRVVILVDSSLSMASDDHDATPSEPNRSQQVAGLLADGKLLGELRKTHEVAVFRFDDEVQGVASFDRLPPNVANEAADEKKSNEPRIDWSTKLAPDGPETRLGQALRQVINDERGSPLSGVVVFTDGQQNAGSEASSVVSLAREVGVPIYPVGIGSDKLPVNVRISDLVVPARAYPGDAFTVTGYVQAQGMPGKTVMVELMSRTADAGGEGPARLERSEQVTLGAGGEAVPVKFQITPDKPGRRTLILRLRAPSEDRNADDNQREASVEVVTHKTRVLLVAGGATREYQFLRNVLYRDKNVDVDVLLQTGNEGISQEADELLDDFPSTREAMFAYDAVVAFDPDWRDLDATQVDLLNRWVGEQAGGLVVIAGPIYMDAWLQGPGLDKIRELYPVEFSRRIAVVDEGRYGSKTAAPLDFTRDGIEAQFLWLGDTASTSTEAWSDFKGVYGFYDVRGPKLGATVYARFGQERAGAGDAAPAYMVGQYFGSGQVFYLGSGEMWRLRGERDGLFEAFYTKLIRHVSQGRLARGSSRGLMMTEGDRFTPGNTVEVRAQLTNAHLEPLEQPKVAATVVGPDGALDPLELKADATRLGNYRGSFTVRREGSYRIELLVPESKDVRLTAGPIQVTVPDIERDHIQRNDAVLGELASQTGGRYFIGLNAAMGGSGPSLVEQLRDASRTTTLAAAPDRLWDNYWVLGVICGALSLEWLTRRLLKLA
ncbi:MAG TPA: vWA domain-containing protein [Pirellulales bacterium]|nr:vWA domain-containing protein [Pirellulales bacterium]